MQTDDSLVRLLAGTVGVVALAVARAVIGPGRRQMLLLSAGTLAGFLVGVLVASVMAPWTNRDILWLCASVGMALGWVVAWLSACRLPPKSS